MLNQFNNSNSHGRYICNAFKIECFEPVAHKLRKGDKEGAKKLMKGFGRATGKILLGGGALRDVPVFHELATCGDSLGDMIGGADRKAAEQKWHNYAEQSFFGSGIYAAHEARMGNMGHARELGKGMGKAAAKGLVVGGAVTLTAVSGKVTHTKSQISEASILVYNV